MKAGWTTTTRQRKKRWILVNNFMGRQGWEKKQGNQ